jgi:hypothetical protein
MNERENRDEGNGRQIREMEVKKGLSSRPEGE